MKNKGFTLFEILIITVVLAIIFLFSIPIVKMVIENSRFGAFENSVYSAFDAIDNYIAANRFIEVPESGMDIAMLDESILKNNNFDEGVFILVKNKPKLVYIKQGNYCAKGDKDKLITTDKGCGALDTTAPKKANVFVKNIIGKTIYLVAAGVDNESEIIKYELSIDGRNYYTNSNPKNNVFKVDLDDYNEHTVKIKVTNESNMSLESEKKKIKLKKETNVNIFETKSKEYVQSSKKINFEKDKSIKYYYSFDLENWTKVQYDFNEKNEKINNDININENKVLYIKCEDKNNTYYNTLNISNIDTTLNGAYPDLLEGMIPVVYDGEKWLIANKKIKYWDYDNKIWANVVFVRKNRDEEDSESRNREYYMSDEAIGTEIYKNDILAYYVWIPKYSYKIWNMYGKNNERQEIEIEFENKKVKNKGKNNNEFLTHNAFLYKKANGFWVSKYLNSADIESDCYITNSCDKNNMNVYSLDRNPIKNISISNASKISEDISKKFNIYGLDIKASSHLLTNLEWGAIAYLTNSKYGDEGISTTGNFTGVMGFGEVGEYVMANYNNDTGYSRTDNSGFEPSGKINWPKKFIDIYKSISIKSFKLGDATLETIEWTEGTNKFVNGEYPFMIRGLNGIFSFTHSSGSAKKDISFRTAITK